MNNTQIYIAISIAVLVVIAILIFIVQKRGRENRFTPLAGLAFGFILAGLFFDENRFIGYSLMGVGVLLAIIDIFRKPQKKQSGEK